MVKTVKDGVKNSEELQPKRDPVVKKVESLDSSDYITLDFKKLSIPAAIIISTVILTAGISAAIYFGLKARPVEVAAPAPTTTTGNTQTFTAADFGEVSVKLTEEPFKGKKDAKVVIVEFGDFVCPFCQKFYVETYGSIAKKYIDTGKVRMQYRDFPLSIHEPGATEFSLIGICVDSIGGNDKFNSFHDLVYVNPKAVMAGTKVDSEKMKTLLGKVGVNYDKVMQCTTTQASKDSLKADQDAFEVLNSLAIASGAEPDGIGTPAFVIGVVKDGNVTGRVISGAYPLNAFEAVIEEMLKK